MQEQNKLEETVDSIKDYLNTRYELTVLKGSDKLAHAGSNFISWLPIVLLTVLAAFMLSFALAYYLNTVLQSQFYGFLIVGGAYFVIGIFFLLIRKALLAKPLRNKIIRELFKNYPLN